MLDSKTKLSYDYIILISILSIYVIIFLIIILLIYYPIITPEKLNQYYLENNFFNTNFDNI